MSLQSKIDDLEKSKKENKLQLFETKKKLSLLYLQQKANLYIQNFQDYLDNDNSEEYFDMIESFTKDSTIETILIEKFGYKDIELTLLDNEESKDEYKNHSIIKNNKKIVLLLGEIKLYFRSKYMMESSSCADDIGWDIISVDKCIINYRGKRNIIDNFSYNLSETINKDISQDLLKINRYDINYEGYWEYSKCKLNVWIIYGHSL